MKSREEYNAYMRRYMAERYSRRRAAATDLLGGECVICGSTDRLEFDHTDRASKAFDIGRIILGRWDRVVAELAKCQLLCRSHHEEKSWREQTVGHGGGKAGVRKCPCDLCLKKRRDYMRQYMRDKRAASLV